jgi:hypothetical protein
VRTQVVFRQRLVRCNVGRQTIYSRSFARRTGKACRQVGQPGREEEPASACEMGPADPVGSRSILFFRARTPTGARGRTTSSRPG